MRKIRRFMLIPTLLAVAQTSDAVDLQSFETARNSLFPDVQLTPADFTLTAAQVERLKSEYNVPVMRPRVKAWRTNKGDWLFLDQVYGRDDIVTYLVAVTAKGTVGGIEVLNCAEGFCNELYTPQWRARLRKQTAGKWEPQEVVPIVSGSTLSSTHVAEGVKKILAIHARFLPSTP